MRGRHSCPDGAVPQCERGNIPGGTSAAGDGDERQRPRIAIIELWAIARVDLGLSDAEFLRLAPVALDALIDRLQVRRDEARWRTAAIRSDIWNVNRDLENNELLTAADFMPGAKSQAEKDREFVEMVQRGERFKVDPEKERRFRNTMKSTFADAADPQQGPIQIDLNEVFSHVPAEYQVH